LIGKLAISLYDTGIEFNPLGLDARKKPPYRRDYFQKKETCMFRETRFKNALKSRSSGIVDRIRCRNAP
jgi:hypothetical protein